MNPVARAVACAQRQLTAIYGLDLDLCAEDFVVSPERARQLISEPCPRTGVVVVEEDDGPQLGLYVDPRDHNEGTIVEETSHLLFLAWHAARGLGVSRLSLELQGEVDRYAVERLAGRGGLGHFSHFRWADWMDDVTRRRYQAAHYRASRYCRWLSRRFARRQDTPDLLKELRRFYRAAPDSKLHSAF